MKIRTEPTRLLLLIFFLASGAIVVFYLSWLPDPNCKPQPYISSSLIAWVNEYGRLRTAIPFIFLAVIPELLFHKNEWAARHRLRLILLAVVVVAEAGQLFLPGRNFDWADIAWGGVGSAAGMGLAWALCKIPEKSVKNES